MPEAEYKRCLQCGAPFSRPPRRSAAQWASMRFHEQRCAAIWNGAKARTHGATTYLGRTPEYQSWAAMRSRCLNPNASHYEDYGGRGITICAQWRYNFEAFFADMGIRPVGTSLDRIDNDQGYEPGNCRWATAKEQAANRRRPQKALSSCENPPIFMGA